MTKGLKACPVCKNCGAKKFSVISNKTSTVILECKNCQVRIEI
jgi:transcription elongation factor Elf1